MAQTELLTKPDGTYEVKISPERAREIRTSPIDNGLLERIIGKTEAKNETVLFGPGDTLKDNHDDFVVLYKLGSGARGHVYVGIHKTNPRADFSKVITPSMPYATRKHYLNSLLRESDRKEGHAINFGEYINSNLTPPIKILQAEIKYTNPLHNYDELRKLSGTLGFELAVLKITPKDRLEEDPQSLDEIIKEWTMLTKANHRCTPRAIRFVETSKGAGYLASFEDLTMFGELIGDTWWRTENNPDFLPRDATIAMMAQFYGGLADLQRKGIYYSDIQQGNIGLGLDSLVRFVDFGFTDEIIPGRKTLDGIGGSEDFFPPWIINHLEENKVGGKSYGYKVIEGHEIPLDTASNVWSGGVLAHLLLTGEYPFKGSPFSRLTESITKHNFADPRGYHHKGKSGYSDKDIELLVKRPLQKDPRKIPSASQQEIDLLKQLNGKVPEDVLAEFLRPLINDRAKSFINPPLVAPEIPRRKFVGKPSFPIRKA